MIQTSIKTGSAPTPEETCNLLSAINGCNGVWFDYDLSLELMYYYYAQADLLENKLKRYLHVGKSADFTTAVVKDYIRSKRLERYFPKTAGNDISLDTKKLEDVLSLGVLDEETKWVVKTTSEMTSARAIVSQFQTVFTVGKPVDELSFNNHRMLRLEPVWGTQNTGRFAMLNPAIQNFASAVKDVITVPKGYVLVASDSGQIDPRIVFSYKMPDPQIKALVNLYNDAYFGVLHYCLMDIKDIQTNKMEFTKMEITDELKHMRNILKRNINAVIYNSQNDSDPVMAAMIKRIGHHKMHVDWVEGCRQQMLAGNYIFHTAFGHPVDVRKGSNTSGKYKDASEESVFNHWLRSAINAAIQGTAADLHRMALEDEKKYLLMKASDSFIMLSVHDAIYTAVAEDTFDEEIEFISHCPEYQVDDWIHIYSEAEIGQHKGNPIFTADRY